MIDLITVYSSNIPIDCHILKGRLESDGIDCFIFDENLIWVHPFWAIAIGGVKLKVPTDQQDYALKIINSVKQDNLVDEKGEYPVASFFENEIQRQNEILMIKHRIRDDFSLVNKPEEFALNGLDQEDLKQIIEFEKEFHRLREIRESFSWRQFWYEFLDFHREFFKYLRKRPPDHYIEKEIVERYFSQIKSEPGTVCPKCKSDNVSFGYAVDYNWHFLYLLISVMILLFVFTAPFPPIRKNHHCFNCRHNFF